MCVRKKKKRKPSEIERGGVLSVSPVLPVRNVPHPQEFSWLLLSPVQVHCSQVSVSESLYTENVLSQIHISKRSIQGPSFFFFSWTKNRDFPDHYGHPLLGGAWGVPGNRFGPLLMSVESGSTGSILHRAQLRVRRRRGVVPEGKDLSEGNYNRLQQKGNWVVERTTIRSLLSTSPPPPFTLSHYGFVFSPCQSVQRFVRSVDETFLSLVRIWRPKEKWN